MKQYLFVFFFILIPFVSKGQTDYKPVQYQVTVSTGIPMSRSYWKVKRSIVLVIVFRSD